MRITGVILLAAALTGCANFPSRNEPIWVWPDMKAQEKYKAQAESPFFADRRASRRPVEGAIAVGHLKEDAAYVTGVKDGNYVAQNPEPLTPALLAHGQERFNIYCAPCHDRTGSGRGVVAARATWVPGNLHDERIVGLVDGEIFHVITNGRRSMPGYRFQVSEADRWAIVGYVRALQRAYRGGIDDVPAALKDKLR
jgi:mono/diheme cytochrome c family protein